MTRPVGWNTGQSAWFVLSASGVAPVNGHKMPRDLMTDMGRIQSRWMLAFIGIAKLPSSPESACLAKKMLAVTAPSPAGIHLIPADIDGSATTAISDI